MQTFGAEMTGNQRTLPRIRLRQQLKKHRERAAFRGEEERRARLVTELRKARITGIRVPHASRQALRRSRSVPTRWAIMARGSQTSPALNPEETP